ncbi:MAG TPA: hypothetical protein PLQ95_06905 [Thiobacillus sp.]|nr:hypothetical protein [Thiobacillus sp.]
MTANINELEVDLLDPDQEPSDEALELLMREVAIEVRRKAEERDAALKREMDEAVAVALRRGISK